MVPRKYLLKQTGTFGNEDIFSHRYMATVGRVDEFCVEWRTILNYLDSMKQFFIANDIAHGPQTERKCRAILLSTIGKKTY